MPVPLRGRMLYDQHYVVKCAVAETKFFKGMIRSKLVPGAVMIAAWCFDGGIVLGQ